jgi:S-adenosylmethionine hydrolase
MVALFGSGELLEVAVRNGSAAGELSAGVGAEVLVAR